MLQLLGIRRRESVTVHVQSGPWNAQLLADGGVANWRADRVMSRRPASWSNPELALTQATLRRSSSRALATQDAAGWRAT